MSLDLGIYLVLRIYFVLRIYSTAILMGSSR